VAKVHSFDVFDTSLIRKVAAPTDVFRLIGEHIARNGGIADHGDFAEEFLAARILAEKIARSRSDREETTLDEIWENLREIMPQLPLAVGPGDEIDAERKVLLPNAIVAQQIAGLRSAGVRIIFTSDTYLPEEFVREQLVRHGLAQNGDGIYVSSAAGVTKWNGGLFKIVLEREGIAPGNLHHYGDNPRCDVAVPRRLGIKATLLTDSHLNTWERAILSKEHQHRMATSLLAGSMRAFRLSTISQSKNGAGELVATLLGPAMMVWAAWVLSTARRDGVHRLYFVSRDAYLLCRAACVLAPYFGDIDCRHLKLSRQSILLPSTDEISPSAMSWLRRARPMSLGELVLRLGLNWSDVARYFLPLAKGGGEFRILTTENDREEFWNIVQSAPVADLLRDRIYHKRANALAYLRAKGLCDKVPCGIVDIGWYMGVHAGLRKLLEHGASDSTLRGYYLGVCLSRSAPADAGKVTALFYQHTDDHWSISPVYEIFKRIDVLDHIFGLAPFGSVSEYKMNGSNAEPICPSESASHIELVEMLGNAIEAFCTSNQENVPFYSDSAIAREIMDALISTWCINPNKVALKALENVIVAEGTDSIASQRLVQSWRLSAAVKLLVPASLREKLKIGSPHLLWPEAAFHRSGITARFVLRLITILRAVKRALYHGAAAAFCFLAATTPGGL